METLEKLVGGEDLDGPEAEALLRGMMEGRLSPAVSAAALVALRMKGESEGEIAALAREMRRHAKRIMPAVSGLVDTCGTGGDSLGTMNVSTVAAIIAAGAGVPVAKHGNRSVSGKSGSFDLLEKLGVKPLEPKAVERSIEKTGIGFMFAPLFHPAMKNVAPVRKELGIRTVFNLLGPLANPAGAQNQLVGVCKPGLTKVFANVLRELGAERALVVHGEGADELCLGRSVVSELRDGRVETYEVDAAEFGLMRGEIPRVSSPEESADIAMGVLGGAKGAARDVCLLNAGAAVYVGGKAGSIREGVERAGRAVDSGKALSKLREAAAFGG